MAGISTRYDQMGLFPYHTMEIANKVVNVMNDLLSVVQDMMKGEATVTSQTLTDNRSIWNIRRPREHLLVTLHYDLERSSGEQNNVEVNYSDPNHPSINSGTDNPEKFASSTMLQSLSAEDDDNIKCIDIRTANQMRGRVNHHQSALPVQFQSAFSATPEETPETVQRSNIKSSRMQNVAQTCRGNVDVNLPMEATTQRVDACVRTTDLEPCRTLYDLKSIDDYEERVSPKLADDSAETIDKTKSWTRTITGIGSISSEQWNLLTHVKCEPLEVETETPASNVANCRMVVQKVNKLELRCYGNEGSEELDNVSEVAENFQSDKEKHELTRQTMNQEQQETHQTEGSFVTTELKGQVKSNRNVKDESSSSSSLSEDFTSISKIHEQSRLEPFSDLRSNCGTRTPETTLFVIPYNDPEVVKAPGSSEMPTRKANSEKGVAKCHTGGNRTFQCSRCDERRHSELSLICHMRKHHKVKDPQCSYCPRLFKGLTQLIYHERTHTGIKPYQCSYCAKTFAEKSSIIRHERTHTGEKPYRCLHCKKAFNTSGSLKIHERIHTGEKPYQCFHCKKTYAEKSSLRIHERTHTGEKPYQCSYCVKTFVSNSHLRLHERIHTRKKPVCLSCNKSCCY